MAKPIEVREMNEEERQTIQKWMNARNAPRWQVERAQMIWYASQHQSARQIGQQVQVDAETVSRWVHRFNEAGRAGLADEARSGRPSIYWVEEVSVVVQTALTDPQTLELPFGSWTLDRLKNYLNEVKGIAIKRSRIGEILLKEGWRWRQQERWFGVRVDPDFAHQRGRLLNSTKDRRPRASSCASMNEDQKQEKRIQAHASSMPRAKRRRRCNALH
jgi:transposase